MTGGSIWRPIRQLMQLTARLSVIHEAMTDSFRDGTSQSAAEYQTSPIFFYRNFVRNIIDWDVVEQDFGSSCNKLPLTTVEIWPTPRDGWRRASIHSVSILTLQCRISDAASGILLMFYMNFAWKILKNMIRGFVTGFCPIQRRKTPAERRRGQLNGISQSEWNVKPFLTFSAHDSGAGSEFLEFQHRNFVRKIPKNRPVESQSMTIKANCGKRLLKSRRRRRRRRRLRQCGAAAIETQIRHRSAKLTIHFSISFFTGTLYGKLRRIRWFHPR